MAKATMYPTKVTQPNRNQPSGLQGKCFTAVTRSGGTYSISCVTQRDPKYHHEWSNAEEILYGRQIQCGRPSTRMCSHATYYGIKGYRNTCPIAGVNGTYTQPATLRLFFDLNKKGITSTAKIEEVKLSFEHRCTGVNVGNGAESTVWGPNFSGANVYPNRKALTVKIGNQKQVLNKNPPLSSKFSSTGNFVFKNVTYKELTETGVDIIYGNNLETNPGNIYIRNLKIDITYQDGTPYIEGTQNAKTLYVSDVDSCRSTIQFTLDVGYKQGNTKIPVEQAPKDLRKNITYKTPNSDIKITLKTDPKDKTKRKVIATLKDNTLKTGEKSVTFTVQGTNKKISFKYKAVKRNKPSITIPNQIERNTKNTGITSITAKNGCTKLIQAYSDGSLIYEFRTFNLSDTNNIIPKTDVDEFYKVLALLTCGFHTISFRFDNNKNENEIIKKTIEIIPTTYKFKLTELNEDIPVDNPYQTTQNKSDNHTLRLTYIKTKELINLPSFKVMNSTHGKKVDGVPTPKIVDSFYWNRVPDGASQPLEIGTYYPGKYQIKIYDKETSCSGIIETFNIEISPKHKQYFDEIFVRGEDSTAFNYDYLVALEGDSITEPLYVENIELGASYKDIKICAEKNTKNNITGLTQIKTVNVTITNTSDKNIQNLLLELNTLIENEDEDETKKIYEVTSNEWLEADGIFYNFKENFEEYNKDYSELVSIKNLTPDDDKVDEEDVYIHINELKPQQSINLQIPYGSSIEKTVYLQILLFGQPMALYEQGACNDETKLFNLIPFRVYDSILTDMSITGDTDLFSTEIVEECPNECFLTKSGITYKIKNIDTSRLNEEGSTIIKNDPRLVPYKILYNSTEYGINDVLPSNIILDISSEAYYYSYLRGARIDLYLKFEEYEEIHLHQYTDYQGEAIFFLTIPKSLGGEYTIEELLNHIMIIYTGDNYYQGRKQVGSEYIGTEKNIKNSSAKNFVDIEVVQTNQIKYTAGQSIPLKIRLNGRVKYIKNNIIFKPKINEPGASDELTIYYKICNLKNNEGILNTKFKTDDENDYHFVPNEVNKKIYCGINTNLELNTKLTKVIVENKTLNRLYIALTNKKRDNKDVKVIIDEENPKYNVLNFEVDKGTVIIDDNQIIWNIDYIDEDSTIRGYIDLKANEVGYSTIEAISTDFIDNMTEDDKPKFGIESYKCKCREYQE